MTPLRFNMPEGFKFPSNYTNPYSFTGTDANGTYQGGGQMPLKTGTSNLSPGQVTTGPTGTQVRAAMAPPTTQAPSTPQGFTLPNGQYIPAFKASDFTYKPGQQFSYGDSNPQTGYTSGQWSLNNVGSYFPGWENLNQNNWVFAGDENNGQWDGNSLRLMNKSGDTEGTIMDFMRQGDYWVPRQDSLRTQEWDTNRNNRMRNITLGTIAALWGGPQLMAGLQAAPEAAGAVGGSAAPASTVPGMSVPGAAGGMSVPAGAGVSLPGTVAGATLPWYNAAAGALPFVGNVAGAVSGGNPLSTIGRGASAINNLFGGGQGSGGQGGGGSSLLNLLAGLYSGDGARDYAKDLKGIAANMRADADPYIKRLLDSYNNPNAYFESPDAQARMKLEANKLMGIDAAGGRLSNPIDRDVKLQQYAAKDLENYRSGLNTTINKMYQPLAIAELLSQGSLTQNQQWSDLFKAIGGGGGGNLFDDITGAIESGKDLWDVISGWWD